MKKKTLTVTLLIAILSFSAIIATPTLNSNLVDAKEKTKQTTKKATKKSKSTTNQKKETKSKEKVKYTVSELKYNNLPLMRVNNKSVLYFTKGMTLASSSKETSKNYKYISTTSESRPHFQSQVSIYKEGYYYVANKKATFTVNKNYKFKSGVLYYQSKKFTGRLFVTNISKSTTKSGKTLFKQMQTSAKKSPKNNYTLYYESGKLYYFLHDKQIIVNKIK